MRRPRQSVWDTHGPNRAKPLQIHTLTVRPARAGGVVYAPDIRGDLMELPHDVWSMIPITPDAMAAIRSGALEVKKTKSRTRKAASLAPARKPPAPRGKAAKPAAAKPATPAKNARKVGEHAMATEAVKAMIARVDGGDTAAAAARALFPVIPATQNGNRWSTPTTSTTSGAGTCAWRPSRPDRQPAHLKNISDHGAAPLKTSVFGKN